MSQRTQAPRYYTTKKPASRFVAEITELLTEFGCSAFMDARWAI